MNIIFMGTPDFAVPTLKAIINSSHKVKAVFSQRPKPKGRGMEIQSSPVQIVAEKNNLKVYNPTTLRNEDAINLINSIEADIIVVAAYGFIIPKNILESKRFGCINLHPSRLPRFRGAAPLQHTIISGDKESSICVIQMDEGLDTGNILLQKDFTLPTRPSLKWLHHYCAEEGAKMIVDVLDNYSSLTPQKQSDQGLVYASKLSKDDSYINWNEDGFALDCKIRGYTPWPGTYFKSTSGDIKIIEAEPIEIRHNAKPGTIIDENNMIIACKTNALKINMLQPKNKKQMPSKDFVNGYGKGKIGWGGWIRTNE